MYIYIYVDILHVYIQIYYIYILHVFLNITYIYINILRVYVSIFYIYIYINAYAYMYIYVYTHTYIYINTYHVFHPVGISLLQLPPICEPWRRMRVSIVAALLCAWHRTGSTRVKISNFCFPRVMAEMVSIHVKRTCLNGFG